jgi:hypothetical protein
MNRQDRQGLPIGDQTVSSVSVPGSRRQESDFCRGSRELLSHFSTLAAQGSGSKQEVWCLCNPIHKPYYVSKFQSQSTVLASSQDPGLIWVSNPQHLPVGRHSHPPAATCASKGIETNYQTFKQMGKSHFMLPFIFVIISNSQLGSVLVKKKTEQFKY